MWEPITSDVPAGSDISFDPDFEQLEAEVRRLESVSGGIVDWPEVVRLSKAILTAKSKDFRAASYFVVGLTHTGGYLGLTEGLSVYASLVNHYWENGFPTLKRVRTRINAITWMVDHIILATEKTSPQNQTDLEPAKTALNQLDVALKEKLGSKTPNFSGLYDVLENKSRQAAQDSAGQPKDEVLQEKPSTTKATPEAQMATVPENVVGVGSPASQPLRPGDSPNGDAVNQWRSLSENIRNLSRLQRQNQPADPMAYRLLRTGCWLPIKESPPHTHNRTMLPAPNKEIISRLNNFRNNNQWDLLLEETENSLPETIFWLDLLRYAAEALANLGTEYDQAREAVIQETAALLKRIPEWPQLTFDNDQAMANEQTQAWIATEVNPEPQSIPEASPVQPSKDDRLHRAIATAEKLASQGQLNEALSHLQEHIRHCPSGREHFLARLNIARFFSSLKRFNSARYQYEALLDLIDRQFLENWDPTLCVEVYQDLVRLHQKRLAIKAEPTSEDLTAFDRALSRLSRLDPAAATDISDRDGKQ